MAKYQREWSAEQMADVLNSHVAGESNRSIARRYDLNHSTIARFLADDGYVPIIEEMRAKRDTEANAAEKQAEQDRARIERLKRDKERKQRKRDIDASVREGTTAERAKQMYGKPPPAEPKRGALSHPIMSFDTARDVSGFENWRVRGGPNGPGESFSFEDYLDRNDLPPVTTESEHAIRVDYDNGFDERGSFGLRLNSDDCYDKQDIADAIHRLAAYFRRPRNDITTAIYSTPPGGTCTLAVEPPDMFSEADLHPREPDGSGVSDS